MDDKKRSKSDIQRENEKLRKRIEQEFGGKSGRGSNTTPEVENEFLNYIIAFEEQFAEGKQTTVYRYIGQPAWIPAHQLTDAQINTALHLVQSILAHHAVRLNTLCSVDNRTLYRFITEELFDQEMMEIRIPGTWTNFIYEEFHPNHPYNAEESAREFITYVLLRKSDTTDQYFNDRLQYSLSPTTDNDKIIRKVKGFINSWSKVHLKKLKTARVEVTPDDLEAIVEFEISYEVDLEDDSEVLSFDGPGRIRLLNVYPRLECIGWEVVECDIPGFNF